VDINGNISRSRKLKISVLQGSVLGPILFLCFINDLYTVTELLTLMFADDTFSLRSGDDLDGLSNIINAEINKMAIWFRANRLAVNINKTKYMIFHMKGKKILNPPVIYYNEMSQIKSIVMHLYRSWNVIMKIIPNLAVGRTNC